MDKSQAEAIATAMLEPDTKAQEQVRRKRLAEAKSLAKRRKVAWFVLAGALLGAVAAQLTGHRITEGIIWGGIPGAIAGWLFVTWAGYRSAP
ncbi:hypothetical protein MQC88_00490 [Luteimonas sp. 50]|uniref:Uncharacterized protein n=1 Tax=Cognatiluteimonas sedimenti TaxID=2927791 RepID=A0ABT0A0E4_9GAMM|nr:hypothetical protein [Lysobacter sedimenti]MCJ0824448.1 hypothetical protein [Lysobacter sedimenti]